MGSSFRGQHDFVTQAQMLNEARTILVLARPLENDGKLAFSMQSSHPHVILPSSLRDERRDINEAGDQAHGPQHRAV